MGRRRPWLTIALLVNTIASLWYYLRRLVPVFQTGDPAATRSPDADPFAVRSWAAWTDLAAAGGTLVLGLTSGALSPAPVTGPLTR